MTGPFVPAAPDEPPPADLVVALDPGARVLEGGSVVVGGAPLRIVRLTAEGAQAIEAWRAPASVGERAARRKLARRLLDAGILVAHPAAPRRPAELTVVVPARDRLTQLDRCLAAIPAAAPQAPVVVVDDGSEDPGAVADLCARHRVRLLRHEVPRGPGAARNTGLAACSTPAVAFVDSDVVLPEAALVRLLRHLADPVVGAVAPRIRALAGTRGLIGDYEERHSSLDMGPDAALVAPGRPTSFVPSAVLVARRHAIGDGFVESLTVGEDVDLVWRLCGAGWRIRYAPEVEAWHDHRVRLRPFISRRYAYARSIGTLARRHPTALYAVWLQPAMALPWALLASGRPRGALAAGALAVVHGGVKLRRVVRGPHLLAPALVARGLLASGRAYAQAVRRFWSPVLLVVAVRRPAARRVLVAAFATAVVEDAAATRDWRAAADIPIRLLDELIAAAGTWDGCLRARTVRPLLPSWGVPAARPTA